MAGGNFKERKAASRAALRACIRRMDSLHGVFGVSGRPATDYKKSASRALWWMASTLHRDSIGQASTGSSSTILPPKIEIAKDGSGGTLKASSTIAFPCRYRS